jgi:hypothetical protein
MDKKELCNNFIKVMLDGRKKEDAFCSAMEAISSDNYVVTLIPETYTTLLNTLFEALVGPVINDWVGWWLYETEQTDGTIFLDGETVKINSFDELWEAVLKDA